MAQSPTLKVGVSGVRGIAGKSLTPQIIASFAAAFGTFTGSSPIVVGTDTRPSRSMVTPAVSAGLMSVGCTPIHIGVLPVPALQHYVRETGSGGGICITASHNPMEWNALKFCDGRGVSLGPSQFAQLTDLYHQGLFPRVSAEEVPGMKEDLEAGWSHIHHVLKRVDAGRVRKRSFKIVADCCNGAASRFTPRFLRELGCEVVELHCDPEHSFPRNPEPIRAHLDEISELVRETGADLGFAQDADGDRLALVGPDGVPLGEDYTVALALRHFLKREPGPVVVNLSTSLLVEDIADAAGVEVFRSPVGEVNVLEMMEEVGSVVGGEGNGGVIFRETNACRDSFVAMGAILELLAEEETNLVDLQSEFPRREMLKVKVPCRPRAASAFVRLMKHLFREEEVNLSDGVKVTWKDRWLHVRPSNTEPILRIVAEADSRKEAEELVDYVTEYFRPLRG